MPTALTPSNPPEVFISYSHKDEEWLEKLVVFLDVLKNEGIITFWYGRRIPPGKEWEKEIDKHLSTAQVVLLLVSEHFLESNYCYCVEFKKARERHELKTACVIPVILCSCDWKNTPMGKLEALPTKAKPIKEWNNVDEALASVSDGIREVIKTLPPPFKQIRIIIDEWSDRFSLEVFREILSTDVGVDLNRITISIQRGSIQILIEGDNDELARIVKALLDTTSQRRLFPTTNLKSITYIKGHQEHSIAIWTPIEILFRKAKRALPAVKYALLLAAGLAAGVTIVAGFSSDFRIAVFGTLTIFALVFGLVSFSSLAIHSTSSIRPLALFLAWTFVLLTSATSLFIFTGFFFDWPRPLEAYVRLEPSPSPTPLPSPSPIPSSTPLPSPTVEPTPNSTPTPQTIRILITEVPPYDAGGRDSTAPIAGKVVGARPQDYRIVIYSLTVTGTWYVQPTIAEPKTPIGPDGSWSADIHKGMRYVILLVPPDFQPPDTMSQSPTRTSGVVASKEIDGKR
jgi:TIR domain-containing protein